MTCFAAAQEVRPGSGKDLRPTGKHQGVAEANAPSAREINEPNDAPPSRDANRLRPRTNGISWHGGPVMHGTVPIYFIWYGNWANNTATSLLPTLISDLNGSSYEHINTTYYDSTAHVAGAMALQGQANDNYSQGTSLSDASIETIVANHCQALGGCDSSGIYFVLTSEDVDETSGFCTQYCGWHTDGTISGKDIKYAFVGNAARCLSACAEQSTSPNNNAGADAMASIIAHESEEAISDPDLNAWYDSRGNENADKCAWTFGNMSTASNGSLYNFTGASGTRWLIQRNWVNASGGYCAMSY
ncbi:MAG TPA: hypothetical protein VE998_09640 [Terriglobales bacterium]|nr:hypothetical protein [Terriglobales bacterium]